MFQDLCSWLLGQAGRALPQRPTPRPVTTSEVVFTGQSNKVVIVATEIPYGEPDDAYQVSLGIRELLYGDEKGPLARFDLVQFRLGHKGRDSAHLKYQLRRGGLLWEDWYDHTAYEHRTVNPGTVLNHHEEPALLVMPKFDLGVPNAFRVIMRPGIRCEFAYGALFSTHDPDRPTWAEAIVRGLHLP